MRDITSKTRNLGSFYTQTVRLRAVQRNIGNEWMNDWMNEWMNEWMKAYLSSEKSKSACIQR